MGWCNWIVLSSLVMQGQIRSPGMTSIRASRKQRDTFGLNWRIRQMFGRCGKACTVEPGSGSSDGKTSIPSELHTLYARFKMENIDVPALAHTVSNIILVTEADVRRSFPKVNPQKNCLPSMLYLTTFINPVWPNWLEVSQTSSTSHYWDPRSTPAFKGHP